MEYINNIFLTKCNRDLINNFSNIKMRNSSINFKNAILYRLLYSQKNATKNNVVSRINNKNNIDCKNEKYHTRLGFDSKEQNIPLEFYQNLFDELKIYYNSITYKQRFKNKIIAIDGTYNNKNSNEQLLNMGFYDIDKSVPIDIASYGKEGKNREIKCAIKYITENIEDFKKTIIIGDRAYFSYEFIDFLNSNGIYYIIRSKGNADNLNPKLFLKKNVGQKSLIKKLRKNVRIVKCQNIREKVIYHSKNKKKTFKYTVTMTENCTLITNLKSRKYYSNDNIIEIYKNRWDIEVFFKYLKNDFNFQQLKEKDHKQNYDKTIIASLIVIYIAKIIKKVYYGNTNIQINESNLIKGIYSDVLYDLLNGNFNNINFKRFCNSFIIKTRNKNNRSFPRTSKTPFTKWYVKGYSVNSDMIKIITAFNNKTINNLPKNLKTIANRIIKIIISHI